MTKVSIILPTYNGETYIEQSLNSVLNQTFQDWELIIVNDCSTDNTFAIIEKFANADSRIKIITNEINQKLPESLNIGFREAQGEYFTWTSDDNFFKNTALEEMVNYLDKNQNIDLVSCGYDIISEDGKLLQKYGTKPTRTITELAVNNNIGACFMYRKKIADKVGEYNKTMFCAEDYDYWCRIALEGNIAYLTKNLYCYRMNAQSLTATKQDVVQHRTMDVREQYAEKLLKKSNHCNRKIIKQLYSFYKITNNKKWFELANSQSRFFTKFYQLKFKISGNKKNLLGSRS